MVQGKRNEVTIMNAESIKEYSGYKVCVVGVGFVGLTLGVALTAKGISVRGIEKNPQLVENLNKGETDVLEPGLDEALSLAISHDLFKVHALGESEKNLLDCNVFIITVGTPIRGRLVDLKLLSSAIDEIVPYLKDQDLVIVRSTVMVGATRDLVLPKLIATGLDIDLAMCPERTVEGSALAEIELLPQIIGPFNEQSSNSASKFFSTVCNEIILVDSLEAAEVTKLVNNTYRDVMFGFSNEIARIANGFNLSARQIIQAANQNYERSNIALPGPSGGPCLEKDPWILIQSASSLGISLDIAKSARLLNEEMIPEFLRVILNGRRGISNLGILGLSFKGIPPTRDTRGSAVYDVIKFVKFEYPEISLIGFEPAGKVAAFEDDLEQLRSIEAVVENSDALIVLTNSNSFQQLNTVISSLGKKDLLIIDFWSVVSKNALCGEQSLFSWGG